MSTAYTPILMAKYPAQGAVKSRLCQSGVLDSAHAASVARAMLICTVGRLSRIAAESDLPLIVAVTPDDAGPRLLDELGVQGRDARIQLQPQGDGDLGQRMLRQWRSMSGHAVAFFGGDTPDLPRDRLNAITDTLDDHAMAIGPTGDGGYWTLAGHELVEGAMSGIAWGTSRVFEETMQRVAAAQGDIAVLPEWKDVDHPQDVIDLIRRIDTCIHKATADGPLRRLRSDLRTILADTPLAAEMSFIE